MAIQLSYYSALLFLSAIITASLVIYGWRNRRVPIAQPFTILMAAATLWTLGEAIQGLNVSLETSILVNTFEYAGVVLVPVAWFILALYYTGRKRYVTQTVITLLCIIPAFSVVLVATNPLHHLYYSGFTPQVVDGITIWLYNHGPLFSLSIVYTYILSIVAFFLVLNQFFVQFDRYWKQTLVLLIASIIPFAFNIIYIVQPAGFPQYDITPISFTVMGLLIAFGIIRYRLFSDMPVAYSALFHNMTDGVFVTDLQATVIDLNSAALTIVGKPAGWITGKPLSSVLPGLAIELECGDHYNEVRHEIEISTGRLKKYYEIMRIPLVSDNSATGCLVTLRDITSRRNVEDALRMANRKLNLLSDITRHDINNQLTVLTGYLHMVKENCLDPGVLAYIEREERAASTIRQQIQFTGEYQDIGLKAPVWQGIGKSFHEAVHHHTTGDITVEDGTGSLEVYADPLFEKVFYNLIDNSLRYGGAQIKNIRTAAKEGPEGLVITYEDDGEGIPDTDKPKIFKRGFGKTGGQGLFLVQEILAITGITIKESGIPGAGARFEIIVPKGMFRVHQQAV